MWAEAKYYAGMARGIWEYLGEPVPADPLAVLADRVQRREEAFLYLAREAAFAFPDSSLCHLLRVAGCEYADLEAMVPARGLDGTLRVLCEAGVYLTHDEFKGRKPILRGGAEIPGGEARFRNPLVHGRMESRSSGSRSGGRGTPTPKSKAFQVYRDVHDRLWEEEYDLSAAEWLQLRPILPSTTGLAGAMRAARQGRPMSRWFTASGAMVEGGHYRAATAAMVALARLRGAPVPYPQALPPNDFSPVAQYAASRLRAGRRCAILAFASPAVRVADAALAKGLDLTGVTFFSGGEATTAAKREVVTRSGARMSTIYHISEIGPIGYGCRHMDSGNDVHLLMDSVAAIVRRRKAPLQDDLEVDALAFTTLLPFAPRFLINAEMDDTGALAVADHCDCVYSRLGMTTVIRGMASFGKLTGQGVTLFGVDVLQILERALPSRFGGAPGDYQVVERDMGSQTAVELRVSPRLPAATAQLGAVRDFFLDELRRYYGGRTAARIWTHAGALRAVAEEPIVTYTGKVLPLALMGQDGNRK